MSIIRWSVKHPIIAIWVLGAIAILLPKVALFQGDHEVENSEVAHQIEETHKVNKEVENTHKTVTDEVTVDKKDSKEEVSHEIANSSEEEVATKTEEAKTTDLTVADSATNKTTDDTKADVKETAKQTVAKSVNNSDDVVSVMAVTTESSPDSVQEEAIVQKVREAQPTAKTQQENTNQNQSSNDASSLAQTNTASELLIMAREAYWNNGFDESVELYMQLIKLEPNVLDYKGELGNVYWKQGYPKKAAELYSEIALPMIENGNSDKVANMVGFIGLFYPDRAATIHQKLMSNMSGAK